MRKQTVIPLPDLLTPIEVARFLRFDDADEMKASNLKKLLNRLGIPYAKAGTLQFYERGPFLDWFAHCRRTPKPSNAEMTRIKKITGFYPKELLTIVELAEILRFENAEEISTASFKRRFNKLGIPHVKIGTRQLYERIPFLDWFAQCRRQPSRTKLISKMANEAVRNRRKPR